MRCSAKVIPFSAGVVYHHSSSKFFARFRLGNWNVDPLDFTQLRILENEIVQPQVCEECPMRIARESSCLLDCDARINVCNVEESCNAASEQVELMFQELAVSFVFLGELIIAQEGDCVLSIEAVLLLDVVSETPRYVLLFYL